MIETTSVSWGARPRGGAGRRAAGWISSRRPPGGGSAVGGAHSVSNRALVGKAPVGRGTRHRRLCGPTWWLARQREGACAPPGRVICGRGYVQGSSGPRDGGGAPIRRRGLCFAPGRAPTRRARSTHEGMATNRLMPRARPPLVLSGRRQPPKPQRKGARMTAGFVRALVMKTPPPDGAVGPGKREPNKKDRAEGPDYS